MDAFKKINAILEDLQQQNPQTRDELEAFRIQYLGTKNVFKALTPLFRTLEPKDRGRFGQLLNQAKKTAKTKFNHLQEQLSAAVPQQVAHPDLTAPPQPMPLGARHPVSLVQSQIVDIFQRIGFTVVEDREIEKDWFNFTALGMPQDHPARDMQDTFYIQGSFENLLRTHTSSVQTRYMSENDPPIRIIAPGRVYRNEAISTRSHCQFHQIEGLYIAENVSFADLRQTIDFFAKEMFSTTKIRMRPSYFPFTEPSAEVDVHWGTATEMDRKITKGTGWLEILGCGMVDPKVLTNCAINSEKYTGFAFGLGIERIAMLKYQIEDIRLFFENDVRFLQQFQAATLF